MHGELLAWYDGAKRTLPWRGLRDPYAILVSEFMLQQTQVAVVREPFASFMRRFPTVEALAAAPLEDVLAAWSGLGYYRRARNLHSAARAIAAAGEFPRTLSGLCALPGIGEYTAAAVGSIAFDLVEPVLDGNVLRVLARLEATADDTGRTAVRARLRGVARGLVDPIRPGDSNQALMELGATVCTPQKPGCPVCPLKARCAAWASGEPERYPTARTRRATERHGLIAVLVERRGKFLFMLRGEERTLLGGTWEVPWVAAGEPAPEQALAARYGGRFTLGEPCGKVKHTITFRSLAIEVRRGRFTGRVASGVEAAWLTADELARQPHSSLVKKILRRGAEPAFG